MEDLAVVPAVRADVAAVTEVITALESSLYPQAANSFSQEDLVDEWSDLDLERNTYVVRDGERVVGYGAVRDRGELWRAEGYVHPAAHGRGIGKLLATSFERDAAARGARRIQNGVYELDAAACSLLQSLGYRAVRVFREMRIELAAPPQLPTWPEGLQRRRVRPGAGRVGLPRGPGRGVCGSLGVRPARFRVVVEDHLTSERFDPALWCVVRAGDEIAAGTICTGNTYGGGFVQILFTRRPWRKRGIGAALIADAFRRLLGRRRAQRRAGRRRGRAAPERSASTSAPG